MRKKTNVYVDGFNLYYGLRSSCDPHTPFRWLDLWRLSRMLLPECDLQRIRYFTANVSPRPGDPGKAARQQVYLRALHTLPDCSIYYGHFLEREKTRPVVPLRPSRQRYATVLDTEEKGSDVNLATMLLVDGFKRDCEMAVVVSNDSDLALAIKETRKLGFDVWVLNPHPRRPSKQLRDVANFVRQIRPRAVRMAQFPGTLTDDRGEFRKPPGW